MLLVLHGASSNAGWYCHGQMIDLGSMWHGNLSMTRTLQELTDAWMYPGEGRRTQDSKNLKFQEQHSCTNSRRFRPGTLYSGHNDSGTFPWDSSLVLRTERPVPRTEYSGQKNRRFCPDTLYSVNAVPRDRAVWPSRQRILSQRQSTGCKDISSNIVLWYWGQWMLSLGRQ